tara:strand:- start:1107 stop:1319 length:213 start_codon:yes stop_codon:yes gene_type:complete
MECDMKSISEKIDAKLPKEYTLFYIGNYMASHGIDDRGWAVEKDNQRITSYYDTKDLNILYSFLKEKDII